MNEFSAIPDLRCMCASLRRAARSLTQSYDDVLRPTGVRATQFTILQALSRTGEISQGGLGQILAIDSTTLTRTLGIMVREGWILDRSGTDRRERLLRLSKSGRDQFHRSLPVWERAQDQLLQQLGSKQWQSLLSLTAQVTLHANNKGDVQ
jgi:DNA-binding MarR family transcriptional regulator